jgi:hypothetical protein
MTSDVRQESFILQARDRNSVLRPWTKQSALKPLWLGVRGLHSLTSTNSKAL